MIISDYRKGQEGNQQSNIIKINIMSVVKDGLSEMIFELRHLRGIRANFKKNVPEKGNNMWKEPKT